jgi:hypothetical protein
VYSELVIHSAWFPFSVLQCAAFESELCLLGQNTAGLASQPLTLSDAICLGLGQ